MDHKLSRFNRTFLFVVIIAVIVRVFITFFTDLEWMSDDSATYMLMADSILAGNPISYFPNGFPLYIVIFKLIFRPEFVQTALVSSNIIFSSATVAVSVLLVKKSCNSSFLAILVGLMIALYPNQINYTRHIMTEAPTTFFLLFSIYLLLRKKYTFSSLFLFLAIIFRTSLLPLIPFFFIAIYFQQNERSAYLYKASVFSSSMIAGMALFSILIIFDIIKPSDNLNKNLLISIQSFSQDLIFHLDGFSDYERTHPFRTYFQFAIDNPQLYLKQRLLSLQELWGWPSAGSPPQERSLLAQILISIRFPLVLLAVFAFIKERHEIKNWILFSPIFVLTIVHVPLFSMPRFNVVVEPFLVILAFLAIDNIFSPLENYKSLKTNIEEFLEGNIPL